MSSAAAWSYVHEATHWPTTGRSDWDGARTFGAPVPFLCDFEQTDAAKGRPDRERVPALKLYTERTSIAVGDMVLIGVHTGDPVTAGALEVSSVKRLPDTLEQAADDFEVEAG